MIRIPGQGQIDVDIDLLLLELLLLLLVMLGKKPLRLKLPTLENRRRNHSVSYRSFVVETRPHSSFVFRSLNCTVCSAYRVLAASRPAAAPVRCCTCPAVASASDTRPSRLLVYQLAME